MEVRERKIDMSKREKEITIHSSAAEYLTYVASVGDVESNIELRYEDENIWLTQKIIAMLYDVGVNTINYHTQLSHQHSW